MASSRPRSTSKRLSLLGEETLLARELLDVLHTRLPAYSVVGYVGSGQGNFVDRQGEADYAPPFDAAALSASSAILLTGSPEGAFLVNDLRQASPAPPPVIDCTGALESSPDARIVAPLLNPPGPAASPLSVLAHPAAAALSLLLTRASRFRPLARAVANILQPASVTGKRGVSELHQQTRDLLSFKSITQEVFDAQLSYNLLAQLGPAATLNLLTLEQRIERHLATLLASAPAPSPIPMPSLRLLQAPVFHGYSISVWLEFAETITAGALTEALAAAQLQVAAYGETPPNIVSAAGEDALLAGDIRIDANNPRAAWVWLAFDDLRLTAQAVWQLLIALPEFA